MSAAKSPPAFYPTEDDVSEHPDEISEGDEADSMDLNYAIDAPGTGSGKENSAAVREGSTVKSSDKGMTLQVKKLYRGMYWEAWRDYSPDNLAEDPGEQNFLEYALVTKYEEGQQGSGVGLQTVTVNSPYIRSFLEYVFEKYPDVHLGSSRMEFRQPFHEFFHQWDTLQKNVENIVNLTARQHVDLFLKTIVPVINPYLMLKEDLLDNGFVTFEYLWAVFPPSTHILVKNSGQDQLLKLVNGYYRKDQQSSRFILECKYIDHNGQRLGYASREIIIGEFKGNRRIDDLPVLADAFAPKFDSVCAALTSRGKAFMQLVGTHHMLYAGLYEPRILGGLSLGPKQRHIDKGRIMIDSRLFYEHFPDDRPALYHLDMGVPADRPDHMSGIRSPSRSDGEDDAVAGEDSRETLEEEEFRLCSPFLKGYCLTSKQWGTFNVSQVTAIDWNKDAFESLVLPRDNKEVILALAESQLSHQDDFDDIIVGKGQGIIMLLSGVPGVGKTLTAESVAEYMRAPLYAMNAGELGSSAAEVEDNLQRVLDISAKWNTVLLLDECDVFLEQRTTADMERNKLTAIFLRLLEYFKGVMFLTTNRISTFDLAFHSRIHLTINYPALDFTSRRQVWQIFAKPMPGATKYRSELTDQQLDELARLDLNGREIKNIVKTARLLARRRGVALEMTQIMTVLRIKRENST